MNFVLTWQQRSDVWDKEIPGIIEIFDFLMQFIQWKYVGVHQSATNSGTIFWLRI